MLYKTIVTGSQDLKGESPVEILKISSKGLDKTASMQKRAAAFQEDLKDLKPMPKKAYLHVITTGASEVYGANRNCFVAGTKVITDTGAKNIEDIVPGDMVKTGQGTFKPVLRTMSRQYSGKLVSVKAQGLPDYVTMTADHPIFKVPKKQWNYLYQKYSHKGHDYQGFLNQVGLLGDNKTFFKAQTLQKADYVMVPVTTFDKDLKDIQHNTAEARSKDFNVDQSSLQFAYCLGLWLAQGCVGTKKKKKKNKVVLRSVIYTLHNTKDVESIKYLQHFAQTGGFHVRLAKTTSSQFTVNVQICSNKLANRFVQLVGRGAKKKKLHPALYKMPVEWRKAFLCGYIDGDGSLLKGKELGGVHISTASLSLAYDVQDMLIGLGIKACLVHGHNKKQNGCFGKQTTDIYAIRIASSLTQELLKYTKRIPCIEYTKQAKNQSKNTLANNKLFTRVQKVAVTETTQPILVYNIEVAQEHTYCVPFVVHNCDAWNQGPYDFHPPLAKEASYVCHIGEGLRKYHKTYLDGAHVYQQHKTDEEPSGIVKAAVYNQNMHRGELLIEVDTDKWSARLHKKASGQDIYLSVGANLKKDLCCPKGSLVLTQFGYLPIEDVEVGYLVKTNQGNWKPVTQKFVRTSDTFTRLKFKGHYIPFQVTDNHPIPVVKRDILRSCRGSTYGKENKKLKRKHRIVGSTKCTYCNKDLDLITDYIPARDIQQGDFIRVKVDSCNKNDTVGVNFAYLCGMYIGDGCPLYVMCMPEGDPHSRLQGIQVTASAAQEDMDIIQRMKNCAKTFNAEVKLVPDSRGKKAISCFIRDIHLAAKIIDLVGAGSHKKKISKQLFNWSKEQKLAFIAGYLDSDGCVSKTQRNTFRISSINKGLILSIQRLAWSVGIPMTVHIGSSVQNLHKSSFYNTNITPSYNCSAVNCLQLFAKYSAKAARYAGKYKAMHACNGYISYDGQYMYLIVDQVKTITTDIIQVYNLQVAQDHTYNVQGVDVHNCSACGNEAHTLDEHCQHIKKQAGMTLQDGTRICMINPEPKFYDISGVNVPADTMAYVLRKVASGAPAEDAIQERYLFNTSRPPMSFSKIASTLSKLSAIEKRLICKSQDDPLFTNQKEAQDEFLHAVENYDSDQVIDQCNRKAILMSPRMFFKLIGKESPQKELFDTYADTCDCGCENLMQDMEMDPHFRGFLTDGSFDTSLPADLNLANILQAFVPDFGVSRPALNGKSIRIQIHMGKPLQNKPSKELKDKIEQKKGEKEDKESDKEEENQDIEKTASLVNDEFRRTYARYVLGFAARNNQDTCYLAMQKLARYRTVNA